MDDRHELDEPHNLAVTGDRSAAATTVRRGIPAPGSDGHGPLVVRRPRPWLNIALAVLTLACAIAALLLLGAPSGSSSSSQRIVTASMGVVQSTVSGSGTLAPATQVNVNFKTGGVLTAVDVQAGEHVGAGQTLALVDPTTAQANLNQAQANLTAAQNRLTAAQDTSAATPAQGASGRQGTTAASAAQSASTQAANVASAEASVVQAQASVDSAQQAVDDTTLRAPIAGTVAAVNGALGDTVSGSGSTTSAPSSTSSSSSSSGSGGGSGAGAGGGGSSGGSSSSSSSSSSGNAFIVLVDQSAQSLVVPMSESNIGKVKVGQPATVTVAALPSQQLAARVTNVGLLPVSNSGVVSYDVTLTLEQGAAGLRDGMTATAQIVVSSASGAVTVPSGAITTRGGTSTVTVVSNGKQTPRQVVTGVVGDSTTQIISGLSAGEQVAIPIVTASASAGATSAAGLAGRLGAAGGFGGGGFGGGGGGGAIARIGGFGGG
jgi:macrolide-specific efflux system membrane fusion protein